ncbi:peroxisomal membrane protein PEX14 isoform X2 [Toxorhynchites rutilus septentrionalis]|uniref:peroxisomal membrane protein PEX14 isoform X2 n=1 Tax=Toxorhynchites rutilus septentrionalis TaxID=329112 RepID=UPI002478405D|nr:peroxisomal membrane protein PEX14 isoform X2 [Toxorhynchites rutilus septentrionalis]
MSEAENTSSSAVIPQPVVPPAIPPREHLINTAVKFLHNPNVLRSAINQKQSFLRSKGLTENEIQIACERAGVFSRDPTTAFPSETVINMDVSGPTGHSKGHYVIQPRQTMFGKIREVLSSVALISGLMYGVYLLYKKFIEPLIFKDKKKKPVDEQISELNKTVEVKIDGLSSELVKIKEELNRVNQAQTSKDLTNFKSDLDSIKGLLLNRKQFASPNLPVVPPSIPAWQLQSQSQEQTPNSEGEPDKNDDNDTGSGSGSSDHDVVLKNSDSSLEIM